MEHGEIALKKHTHYYLTCWIQTTVLPNVCTIPSKKCRHIPSAAEEIHQIHMGEFSPIGDRLVDLPSLKVGTCVVVVSTLETLAHQGPLGRQLDDNPQDDAKYICPKIHD